MQNLRSYFKEHSIIASIRNDTDFKYALNSKVAALFILHGDIFNLPQIMEETAFFTYGSNQRNR